jgi:predicted transcriptional regulator
MVERILQLLSVKCAHRRTSQPFTASTAASSATAQWESVTAASHYVVCLECGKKFTYDWSEMRIVR